jgi:subtilisin family serine protease
VSPAAAPPPAPFVLERAAAPAPAAADPLRAAQPFLPQINWTPPPRDGPRPLVAVLDTGVDAAAPDLAGSVVPGRSFVPGSSDAGRDPDGHGTHVAGIVAAASGNGVGGSGVSAARILPVAIADAEGRTNSRALIRGLRYATVRGARVINISFGGRGFSADEQAAIDAAVRAGALVVVAAGNEGGRGGPPSYPGAYRQVVTVAAVGSSQRPLPLSERGPQVSIAAPGEDVASVRARGRRPAPGGALVARSGTSVAAAIVSGVAARLMAQRPGVTAGQIRAIIESTARDLPPAGPDSATGAGLVDLAAALAAPTPPPDDPEPNDDTRLAAITVPLRLGRAPALAAVAGLTGSWRDPRDGFRVRLSGGDIITAQLEPARRGTLALALWRPGTPTGRRDGTFGRRWLVAASQGAPPSTAIAAIVPRTGVYTLEVRGVRGETAYPAATAYSVTIEVQAYRATLAGSTMAPG